MKKYLLILIILVPAVVFGQDFSVSFAPTSFALWGTTTGGSNISAEYRISGVFGSPIIGINYFHQRDKQGLYELNGVEGIQKTQTVGVSIIPLNFKYVQGGMVFTGKEFPMTYHVKRNFILRLVVPVNRFEIRYSHISNGFGLFHDINVGYDAISVAVRF